MTRRTFAKLWTAAAGAAVAPALVAGDVEARSAASSGPAVSAATPGAPSPTPAPDDDRLKSELLFDLVFDKGPASVVGTPGMDRVVVPVSGGTFEGPRLKGTIVGPSGDWITGRPDKSSVLDLRMLLQTDDGQKIYMTGRGIAYVPPGGTLFARILPVFEAGAPKYVWLNNVVAVGVYRPMPDRVAYRIYRIL